MATKSRSTKPSKQARGGSPEKPRRRPAKARGKQRSTKHPRQRATARGRRLPRLRTVLFLMLGVGLLAIALFDLTTISSVAMTPAVDEGDLVVVNRLAPELVSPDVGDVVLVRRPDDRTGELLTRVVATQDDHVVIGDDGVTVNGEVVLLDDPSLLLASRDVGLLAEIGARRLRRSADSQSLVVPKGHVFVLGDNHGQAFDSRRFGAIPSADIVGYVSVVVRSEADDGGVFGRWFRLVDPLW